MRIVQEFVTIGSFAMVHARERRNEVFFLSGLGLPNERVILGQDSGGAKL